MTQASAAACDAAMTNLGRRVCVRARTAVVAGGRARGGGGACAWRGRAPQVAEVVNHTDAEESAQFRLLSGALFQKPGTQEDDEYAERSAVFEQIIEFFPAACRQPKDSLADLVRL